MVMDLDTDVTIVKNISLLGNMSRRNYLGASSRLVGPAFHEITPRITFNPFNLIDRVRVGVNGDVFAIRFNKCLIT